MSGPLSRSIVKVRKTPIQEAFVTYLPAPTDIPPSINVCAPRRGPMIMTSICTQKDGGFGGFLESNATYQL